MNPRALIILSLLVGLHFGKGATPVLSGEDVIAVHTGHISPGEATGNHHGWHWNRIGTWGEVGPVALKDSENNATSVRWTTVKRFSFHFKSRLIDHCSEAEGGHVYPPIVLGRGYHLAPREIIGNNGPFSTAEVILDGTDPTKRYKLTFIATGIDGFNSDLALHIVANGKTSASDTLLVHAGENAPAEVTIPSTYPDDNGEITLLFTVPSGYQRGTLNAIILSPSH